MIRKTPGLCDAVGADGERGLQPAPAEDGERQLAAGVGSRAAWIENLMGLRYQMTRRRCGPSATSSRRTRHRRESVDDPGREVELIQKTFAPRRPGGGGGVHLARDEFVTRLGKLEKEFEMHSARALRRRWMRGRKNSSPNTVLENLPKVARCISGRRAGRRACPNRRRRNGGEGLAWRFMAGSCAQFSARRRDFGAQRTARPALRWFANQEAAPQITRSTQNRIRRSGPGRVSLWKSGATGGALAGSPVIRFGVGRGGGSTCFRVRFNIFSGR